MKKCIYNKSALKHCKKAICYACLASYNTRELKLNGGEELECPKCMNKSIIPVTECNEIIEGYIGGLLTRKEIKE